MTAAKTATQKTAKATTARTSNGSGGFTADERSAMKERAAELRAEGRAGAKKADGLEDLLDKVSQMAPADRELAERVHVAITGAAPDLTPKTWYGMPAYANADGKVVVFFQDSGKFNYRYSTLGFQDAANLDDGLIWPTSYALLGWSAAVEKKVVALCPRGGGVIAGPRAEEAAQVIVFQLAQHHAERSRLSELCGVDGVETRSGDGWTAVRSGLESNDLNGVVSVPGHPPDAELLAGLGAWFGPLPATWHTAEPDGGFPGTAAQAGWLPERTARCAGRSLPLTVTVPDGVAVRRVGEEADLATWLDIAQACEWFTAGERDRRGHLARALPWPRWVAYLDHEPVGMATGWRAGEVAELVDVAVLASARRQGIGTALVDAVAAWAGTVPCLTTAPSPDGWALLRSLEFENVPALPDCAAYWVG